MQPIGAIKNKLAQAIFSKEGPNLTRPAVTSSPKVIPKMYKLSNSKMSGYPSSRSDIPKRGMAINTAGTSPIIVLKRAVQVKAITISLILIGETNKLIKFLLQISSKKSKFSEKKTEGSCLKRN